MSQDGLLIEQRRLEATIARIRWGAVALALILGPTFPNLSLAGVALLGLVVAGYNVLVIRSSSLAPTVERHRRVAELAFALDLVALSFAMLLFSLDPYWTTFFIGTLVIIGGAFRFGGDGAYASALVLSASYLAISLFRERAFGLPLEPQRLVFHISVFGLTALLVDRVLSDHRRVRAEREELIRRLQRRVEEDATIGAAFAAGSPCSSRMSWPTRGTSRAADRKSTGATISVTVDPALPPMLVDRRRVQQIVGNLVQNASRYAPDGTGIELAAESDGGEIRVSVADRGPGVPAGERQKVFDKFYRGKRTKDASSGTGLGLAIAKMLVELHGGRIWVEDRPGGGARFVMSLPAEPARAQAAG